MRALDSAIKSNADLLANELVTRLHGVDGQILKKEIDDIEGAFEE